MDDFSYNKLKELLRDAAMRQQMDEAQGIADTVRRQQPWTQAPPASHALPELSPNYQPPERWKYGSPVRLG